MLARCAGTLALLLGACAAPRPTEFINITFTPSVATGAYVSWDFDLASCVDTGDPRVDDVALRASLLLELEDCLTERGYERITAPARPDFLISYEFWVQAASGPEATTEWARGKLVIQDVATGRRVWRGERKAYVTRAVSDEARTRAVRAFVEQLLEHMQVLEDPEPTELL